MKSSKSCRSLIGLLEFCNCDGGAAHLPLACNALRNKFTIYLCITDDITYTIHIPTCLNATLTVIVLFARRTCKNYYANVVVTKQNVIRWRYNNNIIILYSNLYMSSARARRELRATRRQLIIRCITRRSIYGSSDSEHRDCVCKLIVCNSTTEIIIMIILCFETIAAS